jgi:hypothetical protein
VLPISTDGTKIPTWPLLPGYFIDQHGRQHCTWAEFRTRRPTEAEVLGWFERSSPGVAVACGSVSNGLQAINFNDSKVFGAWLDLVGQSHPGLLNQLIFVSTPRYGCHAYFRTDSPARSQILARQRLPSSTGVLTTQTVISLIAEGGYAVVPPSSGFCELTQRWYEYVDQDITCAQPITVPERDFLVETAQSFDSCPMYPRGPGACHPGDVLDCSVTWDEVLCPVGWTRVEVATNGTERWRRPNKAFGSSATVNYERTGCLHIFSKNCPPFERDQNYTKFTAVAALYYGGDCDAAARDLAATSAELHARTSERAQTGTLLFS